MYWVSKLGRTPDISPKRHTESAIATAAIAKFGFEVVERPPYTSDLGSSDYRSFLKLKIGCVETSFH